ncbi:MAG: class I SAM-dependent methyltransferase [Aquihabitans sp.]
MARLDPTLFDVVPTQTGMADRRSLLACQRAVRALLPEGYRYLEIGSHLGGSIQPHLLDPVCVAITSIDSRPRRQPDARGQTYAYDDNSTGRMLQHLSSVAPTDKIATFDVSSAQIEPSSVGSPVQLCFIDGEHTDAAVAADLEFCLAVLDEAGAIVLHDAAIIYGAIADFLQRIADREPVAYVLPDMVFVIELGAFPIHEDDQVRASLLQNHEAYLFALELNDPFRVFANRPAFKAWRNLARSTRSGAGRTLRVLGRGRRRGSNTAVS